MRVGDPLFGAVRGFRWNRAESGCGVRMPHDRGEGGRADALFIVAREAIK